MYPNPFVNSQSLTNSSGSDCSNASNNNNRPFWNPYATGGRVQFPPNNNQAGGSFRGGLTNSSVSRPICQSCSKPGHFASKCYMRFNLEFPGFGAGPADIS